MKKEPVTDMKTIGMQVCNGNRSFANCELFNKRVPCRVPIAGNVSKLKYMSALHTAVL